MRSSRTFIIAEAGVNHNGSVDMARKLVDAAVEAGADAVKFQSFRADTLACGTAPKADYQKRIDTPDESQIEMLRRLELDEAAHLSLAAYCRQRGVQFLSTPFDENSIDFLVRKVGVPLLKAPSGEITNGPLLLAMARTGRPIILSTGMSTLAEVRAALEVIAFGYMAKRKKPTKAAFRSVFRSPEGKRALRAKVTLLHCTTEYPAPFSDVNLRAMDTMWREFGLPVGLSDHATGTVISVAATALGASVIEKHFTLDRNLPGPDHRSSLEPSELSAMVRDIRIVEEARGSGIKGPTPCEKRNLAVVRRSLVANCGIRKGEAFTEGNIACKRPGTGISPMLYWETLNRKATKRYRKDEVIKP